MAFSPASVYDIKVITRTTSDLVLFTDTELRVVFSAKVTDTIQVSSDGGYIIVFTDSGEFKINVKPLDTVITPSATVSFTPSSPLLNVGASNYARLIDNRFSYLASNVFQGCCGKAPTYVGSLVVAYPDLAALTASSPGTTGVIYTTEDTNLLYWWDSGTSTFNLLSGVQYYANFAAFPLVGEERVLYYDIAAGEMYVWVSSAYVLIGSGTVTSVDLSMPSEFTVTGNPVTTSGTLTVAKANQNANLVYAGPSTGSPAQPTFRALVAADIPTLDNVYIPLSGTTAGNPVTGDVEVSSGQRFYSDDGTEVFEVLFLPSGTAAMRLTETATGDYSEFSFDTHKKLKMSTVSGSDQIDFILDADGMPQSVTLNGSAVGFWGIDATTWDETSIETNFSVSLLRTLMLKKRFWTKAGTPTTTDDNTQGYIVGSLIWDTTNSILYRATDVTTGAAAWTVAISGGSTSPAGSDTQVQFNDGGSFGADVGLTFDKTDNILSVNEANAVTVNGVSITSHIRTAGNDGLSEVELEAHRHTNTAAAGASILWTRSRGTSASPTVVQDGDRIASITGAAYDGTDYATSAQIDFEVDGTPGSNDMPGRIIFKTSPDGSQTLTECMRINAAGNVIVANDLDATNVTVDDEAYGIGWNGSVEVPTKNAVYDKIETLPQQDSLILGAGTITTQTVASGATAYGYLNGNAAAITTNANNVQSLIPVAGTLSRYYLYTTGSQPATGSLVVTVRSNSVDSAITITIAAGSSGGTYSDTTNTLSISAGDSCDVKFVNNASSASITLRSWASILTR